MTSTEKQKAVIQIRDVRKSFKNVHAVRGVNLDVYEGEYIALLGPNGAGKTTLIEMIEGIQNPDSGEILILGLPIFGNESVLRREMGISLQETRFIDKLTTAETVELFASFYGTPKTEAMEVLSLVGLADKMKSYTVNLSGGQRQKLALGIALINRPKILLLDEPTTGLDPNARREIWKIAESLRKNGTTMILTTHYMEEAEELCDRIVIMHKGEFIADGTMDDLAAMNGCCGIIDFAVHGNISIDRLKKINGVADVTRGKNGIFRLMVKDTITVLPELMKLASKEKLKLKKIESRALSLDDIFTSMTGIHLNDETAL
jgi:ABC-2 type transport system ATP-binding protein